MSTVTVPIDLDGVEERVTTQLTGHALLSLAAAAAVTLMVYRSLASLPISLRALAAGLAGALAWTLPSARVDGATAFEWLVRLVAFLVTPKRLVPGLTFGPEVER